jgi:septum formation inhibitor MinC
MREGGDSFGSDGDTGSIVDPIGSGAGSNDPLRHDPSQRSALSRNDRGGAIGPDGFLHEIAPHDIAGSDHLGVERSGSDDSSSQDGRGGIVAARGTSDGFILRLDARVDTASLRKAVAEFMAARRSFLAGNEISLEWVGSKPDEIMVADISSLLSNEFSVTIKSSRVRESARPRVFAGPDGFHAELPVGGLPLGTSSGMGDSFLSSQVSREVSSRSGGDRDTSRGSSPRESGVGSRSSSADSARASGTTSSSVRASGTTSTRGTTLFDGLEAFGASGKGSRSSSFGLESEISPAPALGSVAGGNPSGSRLAADSALWDEPDARVVYGTIRSGQRIESEHSVVICGDVNSGAEIVSGGDVIVLGTLRGIAHAGAYEETGGGRIIVAMNLQPTQLRIGTIISRGSSEAGGGGAELARVDNGLIVVERYNSKNVLGKRL